MYDALDRVSLELLEFSSLHSVSQLNGTCTGASTRANSDLKVSSTYCSRTSVTVSGVQNWPLAARDACRALEVMSSCSSSPKSRRKVLNAILPPTVQRRPAAVSGQPDRAQNGICKSLPTARTSCSKPPISVNKRVLTKLAPLVQSASCNAAVPAEQPVTLRTRRGRQVARPLTLNETSDRDQSRELEQIRLLLAGLDVSKYRGPVRSRASSVDSIRSQRRTLSPIDSPGGTLTRSKSDRGRSVRPVSGTTASDRTATVINLLPKAVKVETTRTPFGTLRKYRRSSSSPGSAAAVRPVSVDRSVSDGNQTMIKSAVSSKGSNSSSGSPDDSVNGQGRLTPLASKSAQLVNVRNQQIMRSSSMSSMMTKRLDTVEEEDASSSSSHPEFKYQTLPRSASSSSSRTARPAIVRRRTVEVSLPPVLSNATVDLPAAPGVEPVAGTTSAGEEDEGLVSDYEQQPSTSSTQKRTKSPRIVTLKNSRQFESFDVSELGHYRDESGAGASDPGGPPMITISDDETEQRLCSNAGEMVSSARSTGDGTVRSRRRKTQQAVITRTGPGTGSLDIDGLRHQGHRSLTFPPQVRTASSALESLPSGRGHKITAACSSPEVVPGHSSLSLADSHFSEASNATETYHDVVSELSHATDNMQHLSVDPDKGTKGRKHYSDPAGNRPGTGTTEQLPSLLAMAQSRPQHAINSKSTPENLELECSTPLKPATGAAGRPTLNIPAAVRMRNSSSTSHLSTAAAATTQSANIRYSTSSLEFPDTSSSQTYPGCSSALITGSSSAVPSARSPQQGKRYSKKRLRGPYGEMLEEEMRKSALMSDRPQSKSFYEDIGFLQELIEEAKRRQNVKSANKLKLATDGPGRPSTLPTSQSLDDSTIKGSESEETTSTGAPTPTLDKVRPNFPLSSPTLTDSSEKVSTSCPSPGGGVGGAASQSASEPNLALSPRATSHLQLVHQKSSEAEVASSAWHSGPESVASSASDSTSSLFLRSPSRKRHSVSFKGIC